MSCIHSRPKKVRFGCINLPLDQVCGEHFNKKGHTNANMCPVIIEEVVPKDDDLIRDKREIFWIKTVEFGNNKSA